MFLHKTTVITGETNNVERESIRNKIVGTMFSLGSDPVQLKYWFPFLSTL